MANRITTRHGSDTPDIGDLLPYELGWDGANLVLYIRNKINDNDSIVPIGGSLMTNDEALAGTA
jgi:hypothetical protein